MNKVFLSRPIDNKIRMNNKPILFVIIGCDTDPANPSSLVLDVASKEAIWENTLQGILNVKTIVKNIKDNFAIYPKITWFLRSDWQMGQIYNDWAWCANKYLPMWKNYEADGDEIGWHPHLWRWNDNKGWYQEIFDVEWIKYCLEKGFESLSQTFAITSTRMGWHFHNNLTMTTLNRLGIQIDLSALSGMRSSGIKGKFNIYDWISTPDVSYHPSKLDYQRFNVNSLSIMELPITTANIPLWLCFAKATLTKNFNRRYEAEIAKHPYFFKPNILKSIGTASQAGHTFLVCYFHPDEMLERRGLFSLANFKSNLLLIKNLAHKHEIGIQFITAREATKIVKNIQIG